MKKLITIIFFIFFYNNSFSQGCSDAGICAVGKTDNTSDKSKNNALDIGVTYGIGDYDLTYISPYLSYIRAFGENFTLTSRLTYSSANGNFGTNSGLGDVFLIGNYKFKENNNKQWGLVFGAKIPLADGNQKKQNYALPMDYQSSLGTFDLFLGTNFSVNKWDFNAVVQIPLTQNKNSFDNQYYISKEFPTTNLFKRSPDALFRTTYNITTTNNKFSFKPNVLFIYHLGEDSATNIYLKEQKIAGSGGLTINANLASTYNISETKFIELSLAAPLLIRKARPDGLTRGFVAGVSYKFVF